jgi:lysophospholipid hydrolase
MDPVSLSISGSATASALSPAATVIQQQSSSTLALLGWVMLSAFNAIPKVLYFVIIFITITAPTWMYTLLSVSLTVTVNFSTLAIIGLAVLSTGSYILRYRYHTYGRTPPEIGGKEPGIEVPDPQADAKPGLSNYLDEFLSAIKVFGYLER